MRSSLLMPPETRTLTAEEYLLAKHQFEVGGRSLAAELEEVPCHVLLLDVRDAAAHAKSHIRGALSMPERGLSAKVPTLPRDKRVVVYGWDGDCELALKAAMTLAKRGFEVRLLTGGLEEWERRGMPLEAKR